MNPETLEALKGSIEKWRKIIEEGGEDRGTVNCPLCALFYAHCCGGCPVFHRSHAWNCDNTPYVAWCKVVDRKTRRAETEEARSAARAELDFLSSLLPKEEASE